MDAYLTMNKNRDFTRQARDTSAFSTDIISFMADMIRVTYEFTRKLHYAMKQGFYTEDPIEGRRTGFLFDNEMEIKDEMPTGYFIVDGKRTNKVVRLVGELD